MENTLPLLTVNFKSGFCIPFMGMEHGKWNLIQDFQRNSIVLLFYFNKRTKQLKTRFD